jgi:hypothetical protein
MANPAPARMFDASGRLLARAELPELVNGAQRLVAQPRTGNRFSQVIIYRLITMCSDLREFSSGNCWHGIYFDIHAKDKPITVTAIRTASSPEGSAPVRCVFVCVCVCVCVCVFILLYMIYKYTYIHVQGGQDEPVRVLV